jgi:hypothetical protein
MILRIYNGRVQHEDALTIRRTAEGWHVSWLDIKGYDDRTGSRFLFKYLKEQGISYPSSLGIYLASLWIAAQEEDLTEDEIQQELHKLGSWISMVEKNKPDNLGRGFRN